MSMPAAHEVDELLLDGVGVRQRKGTLIGVVLVLRQLAQGERAGHGHLRDPVGGGSQELGGAELHRLRHGGSARSPAAPSTARRCG